MTDTGNVGSYTYPTSAGNIKKNGYVVIKDRPCKVVDVTVSKTGKHGHAKAHIVALDIFTSKKLEEISTTSHNMQVPNVDRYEYQLTDITKEGYVAIMDEEGNVREDLKLPEGELGDDIRNKFDDGADLDVIVLSAMGHDQIMDYKVTNK
eukprot:TRINITY_DN1404_c0_g1_i1.p2 TRINITY_DN1404_c0_g1~~TRINITY_DN1404_c0_g1_i1.p2  ORF type:complete len:150 (-),score=49.72 TRINITY_DN1404_c0_g1_i1:88-537(-)